MKRFLYTLSFGVICVALGFFIATGYETPSKVHAQITETSNQPAINPTVPLIDEEGNSPFVHVAEKVKPVVVNISAEKDITSHPAIPFDIFDWGPFFGEPPEDKRRRVPSITSGGSGIIIDESGFIITNNHVISDAKDITVKFADQSEHKAEIIGVDPETDVALIKVDVDVPSEMVANLGDSDKIRIGEWAIAIGNPFGLDWTVTVGVISARGRSNLQIGGGNGPEYQNFIQTDASINFGNSGGPLVNIHGDVIGLNTAINAKGQGIGFAIPINLAHKISEKLRVSGEVQRGFLGIFPTDLDDVKREALGINPEIKGVFVDGVQEDSPADKGGLKGGEVIIEVEDQTVEDVTKFRFLIADYQPETKVELKVWQDNKVKRMKFKLGDRTEYLKTASQSSIKRSQIWLGIEAAPTDSKLGMRFGVEDMRGVLVVNVDPDSPSEGLLEPGDVIVEIGGKEIESVEDFRQVAEELKDRKKAIPFWVVRSGRRTFIPIRPE